MFTVQFCHAHVMLLLQRPRANDGNTSAPSAGSYQHAIHEQNEGGKASGDVEVAA